MCVCVYSEARREPLDVLQGDVDGHHAQDELALVLLRVSFLKRQDAPASISGETVAKQRETWTVSVQFQACVRAAMSHGGGISKAFARSEPQWWRLGILRSGHVNSS